VQSEPGAALDRHERRSHGLRTRSFNVGIELEAKLVLESGQRERIFVKRSLLYESGPLTSGACRWVGGGSDINCVGFARTPSVDERKGGRKKEGADASVRAPLRLAPPRCVGSVHCTALRPL